MSRHFGKDKEVLSDAPLTAQETKEAAIKKHAIEMFRRVSRLYRKRLGEKVALTPEELEYLREITVRLKVELEAMK